LKIRKFGYRTSIIIITAIILLIGIVFGLGLWINVTRIISLWQEQEKINFLNFTESLAMGLSIRLDRMISENELATQEVSSLKEMFLNYHMDVRDRVYLTTPRQVYRLFPERTIPDDLVDFSVSRAIWKDGWLNKRFLSQPYIAHDGKQVKAKVIPISPDGKTTALLLIVERDISFEIANHLLIRLLYLMIVISILGTAIIMVFYSRSLITPFRRLETRIRRMDSLDTAAETTGSDPIAHAIASCETTLRHLKQKEKELEDRNHLLERQIQIQGEFEDNLLSSMHSGIITFDLSRRISSISSHAKSLLNLREKNMLGTPCDAAFGASSPIFKILSDVVREKKAQPSREWKWQIPGESAQWLQISADPILDELDFVIGGRVLVRDITESKLLEEQINEQEHLAALGELSAGIAHEIRNPLGVIRGNADLLTEELKNTANEEIVKDIKRQVDGLNRIITDFLKFAKPSQPSLASVNLALLIKELIQEFQVDWKDKIRLELFEKTTDSIIQADEGLMRQVLVNLISNSIQAIETSGKIEITIKSKEIPRSGGEKEAGIQISIQDDGKGIKPEDYSKLFQPFHTSKADGTGLGLAIAKRMILLHNGFIEFETAIKKGARGVLLLPTQFDPDRTSEIRRKRYH
jgi:signal transduction histidine kinase